MKDRDEYKLHFFQLISRRIREARKEKGMKQEVLASKLNITRTSLINIEKCRQHANLFMIFEIATHLDIEIQELLPSKNEFISHFIETKPGSVIDVNNLIPVQGLVTDDTLFNTIENLLKTINKDNEIGNNKG